MNSKTSVKDLTEGNPLRLIIGFALPLWIGFLFQQFYAVMDTLIVGRVLGQEALAAVGCTGSVNFLVVGFCMGLCSGFAIPVAQRFGAKDYVGMRKCVANCLWVAGSFAIVITLIVSINARNIMTLMNTPDNIIDMAISYIFIIFIGIPCSILYNMLSGIIRSLGDSKTPLVFLVISSFMNIGLDIWFMVGMRLGVQGAAFATIISQGISGVLCLLYMIKKFEILHIRKNEWAFDRSVATNLCKMGIPMGLQYSITAIGSVVLQTSVNSLGSEVVASMTAAGKISIFCCCAFDALGSTMATYSGQNLGAGKTERISQGIKWCNIVGFTYAIIIFLILFFWGADATGLFVSNPSANMLKYSRTFLLANSATYILLVMVNNFRFLIQGMGFSYLAVLAGVSEMIARTIAAFALVPIMGIYGAAMASPLAWLLADAFLIPAYYYVMRKVKRTLFHANHMVRRQ